VLAVVGSGPASYIGLYRVFFPWFTGDASDRTVVVVYLVFVLPNTRMGKELFIGGGRGVGPIGWW